MKWCWTAFINIFFRVHNKRKLPLTTTDPVFQHQYSNRSPPQLLLRFTIGGWINDLMKTSSVTLVLNKNNNLATKILFILLSHNQKSTIDQKCPCPYYPVVTPLPTSQTATHSHIQKYLIKHIKARITAYKGGGGKIHGLI